MVPGRSKGGQFLDHELHQLVRHEGLGDARHIVLTDKIIKNFIGAATGYKNKTFQ